ncbi:MAG: AIR synthase family protein [Clostridia bacterium]|nr:AIR synthase family protein [Clostridia bacterium]
MEIGKLSNKVLNDIVINTLKPKRGEVILRPAIGEDCTAFSLEEDVCVMSTDPITGATLNLGKIAVNIAVNDIASCGAEPFGIMITILIPPDGEIEQLKQIMNDINQTCDSLNIDILGGHTEVTDAVTRFVITATSVGRVKREKLVMTKNAKAGDCILMTKYVGMEGTSIIINEKRKLIESFLTEDEIKMGNSFIDELSVVKEGTAASKIGVNSMHDITEGGILGAIWELCHSSQLGALVFEDKIPVREVTRKVCMYFNLNPLKLISSGSMLITCDKKHKDLLITTLLNEGINCQMIGTLSEKKDILLYNKNKVTTIMEPESDELYKVIK